MEENEVKTLVECKAWKESIPVLHSEVIGIKTLGGSGCTACNFAHDRKRVVSTHMRTAHGFATDIAPTTCTVQMVFSSSLHAFWRVEIPVAREDPTDEALFALRQFEAEVQRLEEVDQRSAVGMCSLVSES